MTVEALRDAGVVVDDSDANTWRVEPVRDQRAGRPGRAGPVQRRAVPRRGAGDRRQGDGAGLAAAHHPGRRRDPRHPRRDGRRREPRPRRAHRRGHRRARGHRRRPARRRRAHAGRGRRGRAGRLALPAARHRPPARPRDRPAGRPGRTRSTRLGGDVDRDRGRAADHPGTAARRAVPHLRRPPDGHGRGGPRAARARPGASRTSTPTAKTLPGFTAAVERAWCPARHEPLDAADGA